MDSGVAPAKRLETLEKNFSTAHLTSRATTIVDTKYDDVLRHPLPFFSRRTVTRSLHGDRINAMSATANRRAYGHPPPPSRSSPPRPASKKLPLGAADQRTVLGLGVPVASSRLDPLDEETAQMPGPKLPALLARCALPSDPNGHASS